MSPSHGVPVLRPNLGFLLPGLSIQQLSQTISCLLKESHWSPLPMSVGVIKMYVEPRPNMVDGAQTHDRDSSCQMNLSI